MNKELGLSFLPSANEKQFEALAVTASQYGFEVMGVFDDLGYPAPFQPLITLAKNTRSARVGPICLALPKYSSLDVVVDNLSRLNQHRPHQVFLGLTSGAWMEKIGLKKATVGQLREAIDVVGYLLKKEDYGFEGNFYKISSGFSLQYDMPGQVPILIGAWGEKMAALAGEVADEIKVGGSANPLMVEIIKKRVVVGADKVNRPHDRVKTVLGSVTVVDEDGQKALHLAKFKAAMYVEAIGHLDPTAEADFPNEIRQIQAEVRAGNTAEAVKVMPDDLARRFVVAGTPGQVIRQVETIFAAGADRFEFGSPHGIDNMEGIKLLGEKVLPYFKK